MPVTTARSIFAIVCLVAAIVVATGACLEIARAHQETSLVPPRQVRLRLFSAVVWLIIIGSLCYAVLLLWPERGDLAQARRFVSVVSGALLLLLIALGLLGYDVVLTNRQRRRHEAQFQRQLAEAAHAEAERRHANRPAAGAPPADDTQA